MTSIKSKLTVVLFLLLLKKSPAFLLCFWLSSFSGHLIMHFLFFIFY